MLTIYAFGSLPPFAIGLSRDLRVLWAAEEAGLDYRVRPLDVFKGELKTPDYLSVQPFGCIPAIEDEGLTLFESAAIVFYLAEKAGQLLPRAAAGRARAQQWAFAAMNTVEPQLQALAVIDFFHPDEPWAKARRPAQLELALNRLRVMEGQVGDGPYLLGEDFTAPDILMSTVLRLAGRMGLLDGMPNLAAYNARCEARPAWQRVLAAYEDRLAA